MSATLSLRANPKCTAHAFKKRLLQRALATAIAFGVSANGLHPILNAQFNSGDLPASPWANRSETMRTDAGNQNAKLRLRQPGTQQLQGNFELQANDRQLSETRRPAPVILMGPMSHRPAPAKSTTDRESSLPSTPDGQLQFPRETSTTKKAEWQRVPSSGLVIDSDPSLAVEDEPFLQRLVAQPRRRIGVGLPDRVEAPARNNEVGITIQASQMVSAKTNVDKNEPIILRSSSPALENDASNSELESSNAVESTWKQNIAFTPETPRQDGVVQRPNTFISPSVHPVREAMIPDVPSDSIVSTNQRSQSRQPGVEFNTHPINEIQMQRLARAQRVSHETLANTPVATSRAPEALESLPGFESLKRELKLCLEKCDSLLKRGAVLSAREEASQGLLRLYRTMDLYRGHLYSESAYEKAMAAIREEADFQKILGGRLGSGVQAAVDTHSTEALKNRPLESTSPEMAAMHYRWYARYQLVIASDGHPWAADLLYAYGKTLEKDADLNPSRANMFRNQAVVFYQAATQVAPNQSEAASQLGYALIHLDRMDDAYNALAASIQTKPNANAWNNLAEVFRRTGKVAEAEYAVQQATAMSSQAPQHSPENPEITEVDPAVFAKYSPMPTMMAPQNYTPSGPLTAGPGRVDSSARTAKSGNSFLSKMFAR